MKTTKLQKGIYTDIEDYEENSYLFAPSIQRQKTVSGKPYFIRSYFKDGQDFSVSMEWLARKQNNKIAR